MSKNGIAGSYGRFGFYFCEEPLHILSYWLYQFVITPAVTKYSSLSISTPAFVVICFFDLNYFDCGKMESSSFNLHFQLLVLMPTLPESYSESPFLGQEIEI